RRRGDTSQTQRIFTGLLREAPLRGLFLLAFRPDRNDLPQCDSGLLGSRPSLDRALSSVMGNPGQSLPQRVVGSANLARPELLDTKFLEGAPHVCHNRQTTRLLPHNQNMAARKKSSAKHK